jgi:hypothetical protein
MKDAKTRRPKPLRLRRLRQCINRLGNHDSNRRGTIAAPQKKPYVLVAIIALAALFFLISISVFVILNRASYSYNSFLFLRRAPIFLIVAIGIVAVTGPHAATPTSFFAHDVGDGLAGFRRHLFHPAASMVDSGYVGSRSKPVL